MTEQSLVHLHLCRQVQLYLQWKQMYKTIQQTCLMVHCYVNRPYHQCFRSGRKASFPMQVLISLQGEWVALSGVQLVSWLVALSPQFPQPRQTPDPLPVVELRAESSSHQNCRRTVTSSALSTFHPVTTFRTREKGGVLASEECSTVCDG